MPLVSLYDNEIRPKLSNHIPEIFYSFNPLDKFSHYLCTCPQCGKREAFIYKNSDRLQCNRRNNCGHSVSVLEHLNNGKFPTGKDYVDVIKRLCAMTGTPFPEREYSPEAIKKFEEQEQKQKLWSDFQHIILTALQDENLGYNAREYLATRSSPTKPEFGFYPGAQYIQKELEKLGHLPSDIKAAGVIRNDWDGRITYPIRHRGKIVDFWARDITGTVEKNKKYLRMSRTSADDTAVLFWVD